MKKKVITVALTLAAFLFSGGAIAGGKWYNGDWFDVKCYGCPYLPTDTPGKYRKANDGEANPGMDAMNEVNAQQVTYKAAKVKYKETFTEADAKAAADSSFSTFAEAVIWNNMAFHLITTAGNLDIAQGYLDKAKKLLDDASALAEDTDNKGKNEWSAIENTNRGKCLKWVTKNLDWTSKKH